MEESLYSNNHCVISFCEISASKCPFIAFKIMYVRLTFSWCVTVWVNQVLFYNLRTKSILYTAACTDYFTLNK